MVLIRGDEWCYVVFRRDRRKGLPLFASVLYVSNPALFRAMARPFARHLLIHHGAPATLAEDRIVGYRPRPSLRLRSPRRKMFRSPSLAPVADRLPLQRAGLRLMVSPKDLLRR